MEYNHSHDLFITAIAVIIGILASYTALDLTGRVTATTGHRRIQWLVGGAIVMGSGIWSMHFTAMMAFQLPIPIFYDVITVGLSWIAAIGAAGMALYTASRESVSIRRLCTSGVAMAVGIGLMHYVGMAAMRQEAILWYTPFYFLLSIVVAIIASVTALWLFIEFRAETPSKFNWMKVVSAIVMGGAISGTHFVGMHAVHFTAAPGILQDTIWSVDISSLGTISIILITFVVLGFSLFLAIVDQRLSLQDNQLKAYIQQITDLNIRLKEENVRLGSEVEITKRLQQMILPRKEELDAVLPLDISGFMEPASEVGGDYYDVLSDNGHIKIGIGDVTDHGLESGVIMLMAQTAVRTLLISGESDPVRFLDILNQTVYGNVQRMQTDRNLTLSLLDYATNGEQGGTMRLSGQHEEMIVIRQDGTIEVIDTIDLGFPIGLDQNIKEFLDHRTVVLKPGDGVVLYTDGITEAENSTGEKFGLERLIQSASKRWSESAMRIQQSVINDLKEYINGHIIYDDITILVAKQR